MKQYNIIKKKITKRAFEIIRNSKLICFMNSKYINKYKIFLEKYMENEKKSFFKYLKKNWLNKNPKIYNYYDLICKDNEYNNKIFAHFYATNNVAESIHAKISKFLPKNKISNNDFLYYIKKILNINQIKLNKIKRKDYTTRYLRKIALNIKDENFNWISYDYFKRLQR